jgi:hypothetical protein
VLRFEAGDLLLDRLISPDATAVAAQ